MLDAEVLPLEVLSDLLEHPSLPFDGVELLEGVQLLLLSLKCLVELEVIQLVASCLQAEDLRNQGLLLLRQSNSILCQLTKEEPFAQSAQLVHRHCHRALFLSSLGWLCLLSSSFFFEELIILLGQVIEELVSIDGQLVDDLLDQWSHLHESVDSTTDLLVE